MHGTRSQTGEDTFATQHYALDRLVIGEHRYDSVATTGLSDAGGNLRALRNEGLGLGRRAIIDRHVMTRFQQVGCHSDTHFADTYESYVHGTLLIGSSFPQY